MSKRVMTPLMLVLSVSFAHAASGVRFTAETKSDDAQREQIVAEFAKIEWPTILSCNENGNGAIAVAFDVGQQGHKAVIHSREGNLVRVRLSQQPPSGQKLEQGSRWFEDMTLNYNRELNLSSATWNEVWVSKIERRSNGSNAIQTASGRHELIFEDVPFLPLQGLVVFPGQHFGTTAIEFSKALMRFWPKLNQDCKSGAAVIGAPGKSGLAEPKRASKVAR